MAKPLRSPTAARTRLLCCAAATLASLLLGGCMIPPYKEPAGFSSSYFRHLHDYSPPPHVQAGQPAPLPPPFVPAPEDGGVIPVSVIEPVSVP